MSFYSNCSFSLIKSIVIVSLELQRRSLLFIPQQLVVDLVELRERNRSVAASEPHEHDHVDKHETGEQEELVNLRLEEFGAGDDDHDEVTESDG